MNKHIRNANKEGLLVPKKARDLNQELDDKHHAFEIRKSRSAAQGKKEL